MKIGRKKQDMSIIYRLKNLSRCILICKKYRRRLVYENVCLISSNCNGGCILHDLGLEFRSPFVNLWIRPKDYIKLLQNLEEYMGFELRFVDEPGISYPVGILKDVKIYFQHYKTKKDAKIKWNSRIKRMDYNNLFVLFTDRDGCTEEDLIAYDSLPFENKVVFVHKPYPNIKSAVYIKGFEEDESVGICSEYKSGFSCKKYYDDFNYVSWFNLEHGK